ncbi:hypothetical protein [Desulfonatronum thioautotrophicum]|uniref:hypothetical protein n=1 Tax=Desulfonatronum thioautotrophicum TaxID=617001 RepID=UPI0005EAFCCA|nr:hypothetical protein [Desulfonatronum thioautotrophicum]
MVKKILLTLGVLFWLSASAMGGSWALASGFTQEDRERLVRMEATLQMFMEQTKLRLGHVDNRLGDLRSDMNNRFEQLTSILWMLVGLFSAMTVGTIGFAFWDRRTMAIQAIEKDGSLSHLIQALRQLAPDDPKLASVLRTYKLL